MAQEAEAKYSVKNLLDQQGASLNLTLLLGHQGLDRLIKMPQVQRPGICLTGFLGCYTGGRILIMGSAELKYLEELDESTRERRLASLLTETTPAVIVARNLTPLKELSRLCRKRNIPLLSTPMLAMDLMMKLNFVLHEELSGVLTLHGTLIEVFGLGLLLKGHSAVGKSEAALGLVERGHRLLSDDIVKVRIRGREDVEGFGPDLTKHFLEIRGIGLVNVAHLYGAVCVRETKQIDLIVKLEEWNNRHFYDRVGLDEKFYSVHGRMVPYYLLPVKPGRNVVLLVETLARLHCIRYGSEFAFPLTARGNRASPLIEPLSKLHPGFASG